MQVSKATTILFTNFPNGWIAEKLWNVFKNYGHIIDVYIPFKRNIRGQRFGFISYAFMDDATNLILSLINKLWIGSYKLRFFIARNSRVVISYQKRYRALEPPRKKKFANVVKEVSKPIANSSATRSCS